MIYAYALSRALTEGETATREACEALPLLAGRVAVIGLYRVRLGFRQSRIIDGCLPFLIADLQRGRAVHLG